ncbi:hypothetical protein FACS189499_01950 [Clostridia bacterium]|nr:hypothetical protein FACS189499_01950 [Clostridia bacterium]
MEIVKEKTACFSGHRDVKPTPLLIAATERAMDLAVSCGVNTFVCGGAAGFDTIAAMAVIESREIFGFTRLILVLPFRKTSGVSREYLHVLDSADEVICLSDNYYDGCMRARNAKMIEMSGYLIAHCVPEKLRSSGTGQTIRMAEKAGLKISYV